jgi:DNA-binding transcriptional ArsR family regulator
MDGVGAIADPVRREILVRLRSTSLTAGSIAEGFEISRPAISRHLRVLRETGLVRDELVGRERFYSLNVAPLIELKDWLEQFELPARLEQSLDALETEVARTRRERDRKWKATTKAETTSKARARSA